MPCRSFAHDGDDLDVVARGEGVGAVRKLLPDLRMEDTDLVVDEAVEPCPASPSPPVEAPCRAPGRIAASPFDAGCSPGMRISPAPGIFSGGRPAVWPGAASSPLV